jgi:hypothetical protein
MYVDLHVKSLLFFSYFNQIWFRSIDLHKNPQYKISQKSVQLESSCPMRT